jgi:hypothetical protein
MKIRSFLFLGAMVCALSVGSTRERPVDVPSTLSASGTCDTAVVGESTCFLRMEVSAPRLRRSVTG